MRRKKRIAVIGRGTAGALTAAHFVRYLPTHELDWYYDPKIETQSVGEGAATHLPQLLLESIGFTFSDLASVDGVLKTGIWKENWGKNGDFMHNFPPPSVSYHFNAKKLQDVIFDRLSEQTNPIEKNVNAGEVDADFVIDCSGKPEQNDEVNTANFIPVNSAFVTQCYWDVPAFQFTFAIARPHGWVFGVPLRNRCSVGYLYNSNISSTEDVASDVQNVFDRYSLTPSKDTSSILFNNYFRKKNYSKRTAYNGNASFFLEPLEATSLSTADQVSRHCWDLIMENISVEAANASYERRILETETVLMLHYAAGSVFSSDFWDYATEKGVEAMRAAAKSERFRRVMSSVYEGLTPWRFPEQIDDAFGPWLPSSMYENVAGLGLLGNTSSFESKVA